ncbi:857_t:CDS:2, partial [Entrophospora sp. SA101]
MENQIVQEQNDLSIKESTAQPNPPVELDKTDEKENPNNTELPEMSNQTADANSINNSSLITSSITTKTKSPNIEEGQFDILSLVPTNVIPCINLNDLAFKNGVMDERRK